MANCRNPRWPPSAILDLWKTLSRQFSMSYPGSVSPISNVTIIGPLVQKLWHLLYLPSVWPYLAWDMKPEVDCRVMRLPVSILTSYSDFSGSYSYLKVSLKILSDDVLRTLPLERSHVRRKLTKISESKLGGNFEGFYPKMGSEH